MLVGQGTKELVPGFQGFPRAGFQRSGETVLPGAHTYVEPGVMRGFGRWAVRCGGRAVFSTLRKTCHYNSIRRHYQYSRYQDDQLFSYHQDNDEGYGGPIYQRFCTQQFPLEQYVCQGLSQ